MPLVGYKSAGGGLSPQTNYLEDDWDDNALSSRSNAHAGAWFYQPTASQPGDTLVGRYRPNWEEVTAGWTAQNQRLEWSSAGSSDAEIETDSRVTEGSWKSDVTFVSTSTDPEGLIWIFIRLDGSNDYRFNQYGDGSLLLYVQNGGSNTKLIDATWSVDTAKHTPEVTRDSEGNFELLFDGASKGTATDTTHDTVDTSRLWAYYNGGSNDLHVDDLQVQ